MESALLNYSTARGYIQSAYLIMTNHNRFQVPNDITFVLAYHMLLGFAVELYLKSYLTHTGHNERELRNAAVRHNLTKLLELSEADGFKLPAAKNLVDYLGDQHGNFEYRYINSENSYKIRYQAEVFSELSELDTYVDEQIGASMSFGKTPSRDGWVLHDFFNGWRIPKNGF